MEDPMAVVEADLPPGVEATPMEDPMAVVEADLTPGVEATPMEDPMAVVEADLMPGVEATPMEDPMAVVEADLTPGVEATHIPMGYPMAPLHAPPTQHIDHAYNMDVTKRHICSPVKKLTKHCRKLRYERKLLRQKLKRRDRRLVSLKATLDALKENRLVEDDLLKAIRVRFENKIVSELFSNEIVNGSKRRGGQRYSEDIKKLCLTLYYYSPRAYKFLAKNFTLPKTTSLREWTRSVNCEVGVLSEVIGTLQTQVSAGTISAECALSVDEMSIRKTVTYSRTKDRFIGSVDLGAGEVDDSRLATNALVFMAVGLKGSWRHPVAYFLTDHVSGETLAQLTTAVLAALSDAGLRVRALIADGLNANLTMFGFLGADVKQIDHPPFKNYFLHPSTKEKVFIMLDVAHMLKLLRNLLGEAGTLYLDNEEISWNYIQVWPVFLYLSCDFRYTILILLLFLVPTCYQSHRCLKN